MFAVVIIMQQKLSYEELLQQNIVQGQQLLQALSENKILSEKLFTVQHELSQLRRMIFASKSERFVPNADASQTTLDLNVEPAATVEVSTQQVTYTRKEVKVKSNHKGRLPLPASLPRNEIILEPEANTKGCKAIGEEITEELDYTPGKLFVNKYIRKKYAKPDGEGIVIAPLPPRPIDKCIAGAGLLAAILIDKYVDHLPLYRQMQRFKREGMDIPKSTIGDWTKQAGSLLVILANALRMKVIQACYLMVDESPIKVLDSNHENGIHQGYYWVYRAPEEKLVLFDYQKGRGRDGPTQMLKDFKGKLQTDGYAVYEQFEKQQGIALLGCMAHARRYFDQALQSDKTRATQALQHFGLLYDVEREARENNYAYTKRYELRKGKSVPVLNLMETWLKENLIQVTPQSPMGKAIAYTLARWEKLCRYTTDGKLEIDNNWVENSIRPLALGRKNYLFAGSHDSAERAAAIYSLMGTCKLNNINPYNWLRETLPKLNDCKSSKLTDLLPTDFFSS